MTRKDLCAIAILAAAVLALTASTWACAHRVFFNHGDLYTYHWPLRHYTASSLMEGRIPFWNPYVLLGVPHAANPQSVLFYPASILGFVLPSMTALVWDQVLHLLWAGLGAFLLARSSRLPRAGALMIATAYALSPFLIYRITAGIPTLAAALAWAPWAWLAWLSGSLPLLAAVWALQFLSGHPQFLVINAAGMALWAAARPERVRLWGRMALGAAGAMALAAIQWLPTLELLRGSNRSGWGPEFSSSYSLSPSALAMWLWPGALGTPLSGTWPEPPSVFYESGGVWLGAAALALAAVGLAKGRARAGAAALLLAGVLLALGANGPFASLLGAPGLSFLRTPSRWSFLVLWGLWLLAGQGARALSPRRALLAALPLAVFAESALWDSRFLFPADPRPFTAANRDVAEELGGKPSRMLTDPELANPNKAVVYRMRNANGYDAFYPATAAVWAAQAEGKPAADSSRVLVSNWRSEASSRAGVSARLSPSGIEKRRDAWPLAVFIDARGRRLSPDPALIIARPERWIAAGEAPEGAAALALAETRWPGWHAEVNGAPAPLAPWGPAFQAVRANPGEKISLRFEFEPALWRLWALVSALSWGLWLAVSVRRAEAA